MDGAFEVDYRFHPEHGLAIVGDGYGAAVGLADAYFDSADVVDFAVRNLTIGESQTVKGDLHRIAETVQAAFAERSEEAVVDLGILAIEDRTFTWTAVGTWMLLVRRAGRWSCVHPGDTLAHARTLHGMPTTELERRITISGIHCHHGLMGKIYQLNGDIQPGDCIALVSKGVWAGHRLPDLLNVFGRTPNDGRAIFDACIDDFDAELSRSRHPAMAWVPMP
ncbi:MAG: hypothetical protein AAFV53_09640 [Myxococcota bacterium]